MHERATGQGRIAVAERSALIQLLQKPAGIDGWHKPADARMRANEIVVAAAFFEGKSSLC
jgi:hypothetical protein